MPRPDPTDDPGPYLVHFNQGKQAAKLYVSREANPYLKGSMEWSFWDFGYTTVPETDEKGA